MRFGEIKRRRALFLLPLSFVRIARDPVEIETRAFRRHDVRTVRSPGEGGTRFFALATTKSPAEYVVLYVRTTVTCVEGGAISEHITVFVEIRGHFQNCRRSVRSLVRRSLVAVAVLHSRFRFRPYELRRKKNRNSNNACRTRLKILRVQKQ